MRATEGSAPRPRIRKLVLATTCAFAAIVAGPKAIAQDSQSLGALLDARAGASATPISPVREAILRPTAQALGAQTGMVEAANEILQVVNEMGGLMDRTFRFGDLVMGRGVLPPVVIASHNSATMSPTGKSMRVAGSVYEIEEPARFFTGAPSWRDWLLLGLLAQSEPPTLPTNPQLLPRDEQERAFWRAEVQRAYRQGREQAARIFEENLAALERTYLGMRTFYELHARGMVSLPQLAQTQDVVNQKDPNTIIVGDTVFRITVPSAFDATASHWKPTTAVAPTPYVPEQSTDLSTPAFRRYQPTGVSRAPSSPGAATAISVRQPAPREISETTTNGQQVLHIRIGPSTPYAGQTLPATAVPPLPQTQPRVSPALGMRQAPNADAEPTPLQAYDDPQAARVAAAQARIYAQAYSDAFRQAYRAAVGAPATQEMPVTPAVASLPPVKAAPRLTPEATAQAPALQSRVHTVAAGETVYAIAATAGVAWQTILAANNLLSPADVVPGMVLALGRAGGGR